MDIGPVDNLLFGPIENDSQNLVFPKLPAGLLRHFSRCPSSRNHHQDAVARLGKQFRIGNGYHRRRIENDPVKPRGDTR